MEKVKNKKLNTAPVVTAFANHLHVSPRKMRLVTNLVKNMYVGDALVQLAHANKKAAPMVVKLLNSAVANAEHNFSLDPQWLYIKTITTDSGRVLKRYFPRARGSAFVIRRKMCHVNVILEERKKGKAPASRTAFMKKSTKAEKSTMSVDQEIATNEKNKSEDIKKVQAPKSGTEVKMNKIQNKRRLFNRKSGE